jgi:hypothetical protein
VSEPKCETCRYWGEAKQPLTGHKAMVCRRGPPTLASNYNWPVVKHDDWCGEWAAKAQEWLEREP